jgi:YfiH family protein
MSAADDVSIAWTGAPAGVRGVATLRHGPGVSAPPFDAFNLGLRSGDDAAAVQANRTALVAALGLPSPPRWLAQVHGAGVVRFDAATAAGEPTADAAVTSTPGVVLAILTADCLPVLLAATDGNEIGAAHAGWRGLAGGVLEATVAAMRTPADRLVAWLGPAAGPAAYEVGAEVRDAFLAHDARADAAFFATRPGHWRVDLYALARQRLAALGIDAVGGGDRCTISEPAHFYSYRRDGRTGRQATLAWIAP